MRNKLVFLLSFIFLFCLLNSAKCQIWISNNDLYREAQEFLHAEDYEEALPLFLLLKKKDFITSNIQYKIGTCYLNIRGKKERSIEFLEDASKNVSSRYIDTIVETTAPLKALLMLGVAYRINNEPEKAIEVFNQLKDSIGATDPEMSTLIDLHIKRCENAIILMAFPGKVVKEILPAQINNELANSNPILIDSEKVLYYMEKLKFYDAVMRARFENDSWQTPENITSSIGSEGDHYIVGATPDDKRLFFYYYETLKAGEIYSIDHTSQGWTKLKPLNENINTKYHETHASPSADGRTLFFTSNRPGGIGGLDIYMSKLDKNNDWGPAVNLGPSINTPFNEETPFISLNDSILFFSSQGHMNMGGYDVFYSKRKGENSWSQPVNMGSPVSTTDDDLFYYPLGNGGLNGLMSRIDASSNTSYDLYKYKNKRLPNTPRYKVEGDISESMDSSSEYTIYAIDETTSDTVQSVISRNKYTLALPEGSFKIVILDKNGHSITRNVSTENSITETIVVPVQTIAVKTEPALKEKSQAKFYLSDILFEFNEIKIQPEYFSLLDSVKDFIALNPSVKFRIEGYTDSVGSDRYNQLLSRKRAEQVASYLNPEYSKRSIFLIVSNGKKNAVAINTNPDGTDNPEGRKYNRRVTIVPVSDNYEELFINKTKIPVHLQKVKMKVSN